MTASCALVRRNRLRSGFAALLLATTVTGAAIMPAAAHAQAQRNYSIAAGPLAEALNDFAEQSGVELIYSGSLVEGRSCAGLKGDLGAAEALSRLLAGSGLTFRQTGPRAFTIDAAPQTSAGAVQLGPVRVEGSNQRSAALPPQATIGALSQPYAGGQIARGGRLGILGNRDFMDVPFNQTSFTSELIENQQTRSIVDVLANDPSVTLEGSRSGSFEQVGIRGFGVNTSERFTVNGLYGMFSATPIELVERVEVLKGPSAFLNGIPASGTAIGGTINLTLKRAPDVAITRFTTTYSSDAEFGGHADIGRRFGSEGQFGIRVNGRYRAGDTAIDHNEEKLGVAGVALDYRGSALRLSADLGYTREKIEGLRRFINIGATLAIPKVPEASSNYSPPWLFTDTEARYAIVQGEVDILDNLTAYASGGTRKSVATGLFATPTILDVAGNTRATPTATREKIVVYTLAGGLRGSIDTGPIHHEFVVDGSVLNRDYFYGALSAPAPVLSNIYTPSVLARPSLAATAPKLGETDFSSVGFSDTLSALDKTVQLTLGVRRQRVKLDSFNAAGVLTSRYDDHAWTPVVGLVVKPTEQISFYGSYIQALEQGTFVGNTFAKAGEMFPPYKSKQKEVGVKADWGVIATTISAFDISRPSTITIPGIPLPRLAVDGEQVNRGIEFNVFGEPVSGLRLQGGLMLLDAELKKTTGGLTDGNRPPVVPKVNLALGAEWDTAFLPGFTLTGRVNHTGRTFYNAANTQVLPSWTRFDVGARYVFEAWVDRPITLRLDVQNVFDRNYWLPYTVLTVSQPRTLQLSATFDF